MLILGVNNAYHDTAAVLLEDGSVIAAIEEERLNRVKHTNAFPARAIARCLDIAGARFDDVDLIAVNYAEEAAQRVISQVELSQRVPLALGSLAYIARWFQLAGLDVDAQKLRMVPHHISHATSAWHCSGFEEALVLSIDGIGEDSEHEFVAGLVCHGRGSEITRLRTLQGNESLGLLYGQVTKFLGFSEFDEYKVMGLASYGDPAVYEHAFGELVCCTADGWYRIDRLGLARLVNTLLAEAAPERLEQTRRNIAASCQGLVERIVLHVIKFYFEQTGLRHLALAGGVALNCSLVARLFASGMFRDVFVQPASHDAGGALGAALSVASAAGGRRGNARLTSVYWGSDLPPRAVIERQLSRWGRFIHSERVELIAGLVAEQLAGGAVIGWVQGRSEFGPRALGNRSILADPRSARQRDIVNRVIKKREDFRPFAPSVIAEKARDYFELPVDCDRLPFMVSLVKVHESQRGCLQAITHVDGTARIQTVDHGVNPGFWEVIHEFGKRTGVFVLLNTSFNNSAEPIVDSVEDAIVAFLTMELDGLAVGDYWITKRPWTDEDLFEAAIAVAPCAEFGATRLAEKTLSMWGKYRFEVGLAARQPVTISKPTFEVLSRADGHTRIRDLMSGFDFQTMQSIGTELRLLWWHRLVVVSPVEEE